MASMITLLPSPAPLPGAIQERVTGLDQRIASVRYMTLITGGSSGVYKCLDEHSRAVGVFKPSDEGGYGSNNPKFWTRVVRWIQRIFFRWFVTTHRASLPHPEAQAEVWASLVDRQLGFNIVPETRYAQFTCPLFKGSQTKSGSFQEWVEGLTPVSTETPSFRGLWYCPWSNEVPLTKRAFEKIAMLTFLIGGQDCDTDNYAWVQRGEEEALHPERKHRRPISYDNGLSFPDRHPNDWISTRKANMWGRLRNARKRFSRNMRDHIARLDHIVIQFFDECARIGMPLTLGQKRTLAERVEVLKDYAANRRTLAELAKVKRQRDFDLFFKGKEALRQEIENRYAMDPAIPSLPSLPRNSPPALVTVAPAAAYPASAQ